MLNMPEVLVLATSRRTHGGISSVAMAHEMANEWKKYGCRWIATHRNGSIAVKLLYMMTGMAKYLWYLPWCKTVHIHIGEAPSARRKSLFMRLAKLTGKKTIVHFHAFDTASTIEGPYSAVYKKLFDDADRVIVLSKMWENAVCSTFELGDKVRVLHNPCPRIADTSGEVKKKNIILSAGVVSPRKGYHDLIRAFAIIAHKYPQWKLVFAGSGEIEKGKAIAREAGIGNQVEFPGWIAGSDKDRLFRETSVFCLPSYAEGFPMAVLDAWAYGLPVIATPVGGLPDIVHDNEDILLFPPGDTKALAVQLEKMIADTALRHKIESASRKFAEESFNITTIGHRLGKIYSELSDNY